MKILASIVLLLSLCSCVEHDSDYEMGASIEQSVGVTQSIIVSPASWIGGVVSINPMRARPSGYGASMYASIPMHVGDTLQSVYVQCKGDDLNGARKLEIRRTWMGCDTIAASLLMPAMASYYNDYGIPVSVPKQQYNNDSVTFVVTADGFIECGALTAYYTSANATE